MAATLASFEGSSDDGIFTADAIYTWFRSAHSDRNLSFKLDDLKRAFYDLASRNIVDDLASPYAFVWQKDTTRRSINANEGMSKSRAINYPINISRRKLAIHMCKIGEDEKATGNYERCKQASKYLHSQIRTAHRLTCFLFVLVVLLLLLKCKLNCVNV
jgi:hypothetical protein